VKRPVLVLLAGTLLNFGALGAPAHAAPAAGDAPAVTAAAHQLGDTPDHYHRDRDRDRWRHRDRDDDWWYRDHDDDWWHDGDHHHDRDRDDEHHHGRQHCGGGLVVICLL
jgi:hypothetical protein